MATLFSKNAYKAKESKLCREAFAQDILLRKSRVRTPMDKLNIEAVEEQFYTVDDMAKILKVSKNSIYHQIHQGRAGGSIPPYIKLGNLVRFRVSDHKRWYENLG